MLVRGYFEVRERNKSVQNLSIGGVGFVFDGQPDEDGLVLAGADFAKLSRLMAKSRHQLASASCGSEVTRKEVFQEQDYM